MTKMFELACHVQKRFPGLGWIQGGDDQAFSYEPLGKWHWPYVHHQRRHRIWFRTSSFEDLTPEQACEFIRLWLGTIDVPYSEREEIG